MPKKTEYKKAVDRVSEQDLEAIRQNGFQLGELSYAEKASGILLEKASEFFKLGKDDQARLLRTIADEFKSKAKVMQSEYDVNYE